MRTAIFAPPYLDYADPRVHVELAQASEESGWDGYFVWDHVALGAELPLGEAFVTLSAVAMATERIRIGTMITPIARRRPWQLAKEITTLDHLSGGRLTLGIGLGGPPDLDFENFGDSPSFKVRAEQTDEGLEVLQLLLGDAPVKFKGKHNEIDAPPLRPKPIQSPRIPIWIAGFWPNTKPFQRAARWDGCFPTQAPVNFEAATEGDIFDWQQMWLPASAYREMSTFFAKERKGSGPFELVATGSTIDQDLTAAGAKLGEYREAGATWWLEWVSGTPGNLEKTRELIRRGPPSSG